MIQIWQSPVSRDEGTTELITILPGNYCFVLGRGAGAWSVNASDDYSTCMTIAEALGGEVFEDYT